jgi:hypothetical protein
MPENAVYVGRPTRWGNPFKVSVYGLEESLRLFRKYLEARLRVEPDFLEPLRGKDLACWCPLDRPCHADILLELANRKRRKVMTIDLALFPSVSP